MRCKHQEITWKAQEPFCCSFLEPLTISKSKASAVSPSPVWEDLGTEKKEPLKSRVYICKEDQDVIPVTVGGDICPTNLVFLSGRIKHLCPHGHCASGPPVAPLKGAAGQWTEQKRMEQGSWTACSRALSAAPTPARAIGGLSSKLGADGSHDGGASSRRWLRGDGDQERCALPITLPRISQSPHPLRGTSGPEGSPAGESRANLHREVFPLRTKSQHRVKLPDLCRPGRPWLGRS